MSQVQEKLAQAEALAQGQDAIIQTLQQTSACWRTGCKQKSLINLLLLALRILDYQPNQQNQDHDHGAMPSS